MDSYLIGFYGGTAFGILPNLSVENIVATFIMVALSALASFLVTVVLRWIGNDLMPFKAYLIMSTALPAFGEGFLLDLR